MVRRGSTVRVRQRALQKRRKSALCRSGRLAPRRTCGGYGAVYGAFAPRTGHRGTGRPQLTAQDTRQDGATDGLSGLSFRTRQEAFADEESIVARASSAEKQTWCDQVPSLPHVFTAATQRFAAVHLASSFSSLRPLASIKRICPFVSFTRKSALAVRARPVDGARRATRGPWRARCADR